MFLTPQILQFRKTNRNRWVGIAYTMGVMPHNLALACGSGNLIDLPILLEMYRVGNSALNSHWQNPKFKRNGIHTRLIGRLFVWQTNKKQTRLIIRKVFKTMWGLIALWPPRSDKTVAYLTLGLAYNRPIRWILSNRKAVLVPNNQSNRSFEENRFTR